MINMIYSEFLKLKRSYILPITFIGAIFAPIFMCIAAYCDSVNLSVYSSLSEYLMEELVMQMASSINMFQIEVVNIVIISLISSYVFAREFLDKTANILYSYPSNRMKIFFSKFIVIILLTFAFYLFNFIITILCVYIIHGRFGITTIFYTQLKVNLLSMILQIVIVPIPIFIGCISKNIIIPIVYAVVGAIASMFLSMAEVYMQLSPLMLPVIPYYYFYLKNPIDYIAVICSGLITFILFMSLNIYYLRKVDIN